tara:strand:- start:206 stop:925 length:720 start_codon:yes stop_codon:yes gene_type:complete
MKKTIRALLLAAGLGTRLRPLTLSIPKCLVEIKGKPILENWLDKLEKIGAEKVLINTHYLAEQVDKFIANQHNRNIEISNFYEKKLYGTAATLIANETFFLNSTCIVIHADNFTTLDLNDLVRAHKNRPPHCLLTMLTFKTDNPSNCGIVNVDSNGVVQSFHEKSSESHGNLANGAIYVFENNLLTWLLKNYPEVKDFSTEVIPKLMGRIYSFKTSQPFIDIGTYKALNTAREIANELN